MKKLDFYLAYNSMYYTMIQFYHPSKSGKGSASSFFYSIKNNSIFATIMKQSGWDDVNNNGVFQDKSPAFKTTVKLGPVEVAAILDCVERNRPFKTFHDFGENPKWINFVPSYDKVDNTKLIGYDFSFSVTDKQDSTKKESFFIRFTLPEARLIREQLIHFLHKQFSFNSLNKFQENESKQEAQTQSASQPDALSDL